jgi:hypothetical protein
MSPAQLAKQYNRGQLVSILTDLIRTKAPKDEIRTTWLAYALACDGRPIPLFNFIQREQLNGRVPQ